MEISNEWRALDEKRKMEIMEAIYEAIEADMPLAELECLGLEERIINQLERHDIFFLTDLLSRTKESILSITYIGPVNLRKIIAAICNLPELEQRRKEYYEVLCPNLKDKDRIRFYGIESLTTT